MLLHANAQTRRSVSDAGGDACLHAYMTLPVEQYFVLDPGAVERLGPTSFRCRIPRLSFFSVWLEPEVDVEVSISSERVHMRSAATRLRGSDFVERSRLIEHMDMAWSTTLTWGPQLEGGAHMSVQTEVSVWCEVLPPFNLMPRSLLSGACNAVLRRAVPALLVAFVRQLAADYDRWSSEPEYRARRAALAESARGAERVAVS